MKMILHMMEMELIALERPTSDFISPVKAGTAVPTGLKTRSNSAFFTSKENGSRK